MADGAFSQGFRSRGEDSIISRESDGWVGLKAARSIALLSYRTSEAYNLTQSETTDEKLTSFRASSYQQYQGEKLVKRFNAYSYMILTRFIDSHNIFRGRPDIMELLGAIKARTLVVGITTDILYPVSEQKQLASLFPGAVYKEIHSDFGHDGFLIEDEKLIETIESFIS